MDKITDTELKESETRCKMAVEKRIKEGKYVSPRLLAKYGIGALDDRLNPE